MKKAIMIERFVFTSSKIHADKLRRMVKASGQTLSEFIRGMIDREFKKMVEGES